MTDRDTGDGQPGAEGAAQDIGYLLTAYADGELNPEGRAWVEAQLAAHPHLAQRLAVIMSLQAALRRHLPEQPAPAGLDAGRRELLLKAARQPRRSSWSGSRIVIHLAAACLVVAVIASIAIPNTLESRLSASAAANMVSRRLAASDRGEPSAGENAAPATILAMRSEPSEPALFGSGAGGGTGGGPQGYEVLKQMERARKRTDQSDSAPAPAPASPAATPMAAATVPMEPVAERAMAMSGGRAYAIRNEQNEEGEKRGVILNGQTLDGANLSHPGFARTFGRTFGRPDPSLAAGHDRQDGVAQGGLAVASSRAQPPSPPISKIPALKPQSLQAHDAAERPASASASTTTPTGQGDAGRDGYANVDYLYSAQLTAPAGTASRLHLPGQVQPQRAEEQQADKAKEAAAKETAEGRDAEKGGNRAQAGRRRAQEATAEKDGKQEELAATISSHYEGTATNGRSATNASAPLPDATPAAANQEWLMRSLDKDKKDTAETGLALPPSSPAPAAAGPQSRVVMEEHHLRSDHARFDATLPQLEIVDAPSEAAKQVGHKALDQSRRLQEDQKGMADLRQDEGRVQSEAKKTQRPVAGDRDVASSFQRPALAPDQLMGLLQQNWDGEASLGALQALARLASGKDLPLRPSEEALARLAEPRSRRQGVPFSTTDTLAQALVRCARSSALQLTLGDGVVEFALPRAPLDPATTCDLSPEAFKAAFGTEPMRPVRERPQITTALDGDTASYDLAKARATRGQAMDPAGVRPEHFINAMPSDYPPAQGPEAFALYAEAAPSPFPVAYPRARGRAPLLVAIGVVGRAAGDDERRPLRLTLALDISGSMAQAGGLDRVRRGLALLIPQLTAQDSVAIVAFADQARVVLPATPGDQLLRINDALQSLRPGGSTDAADGLTLAYQLAAEQARPGVESRVVLASDGAALTGVNAQLVSDKAKLWHARGITLLVLGCGDQRGDAAALGVLADRCDGQHVQLTSDAEADRVFSSTLVPARLGLLARDAKLQVTWNPERVAWARLIGYDQRRLKDQDFRNDAVAAGQINHETRLTALFEIIPAEGAAGPLGEAAVRYYDTRLERVRELACPMPGSVLAARATERLRLLACAAETAEWLQRGWWSNVRLPDPQSIRAVLATCPQAEARTLETMLGPPAKP